MPSLGLLPTHLVLGIGDNMQTSWGKLVFLTGNQDDCGRYLDMSPLFASKNLTGRLPGRKPAGEAVRGTEALLKSSMSPLIFPSTS